MRDLAPIFSPSIRIEPSLATRRQWCTPRLIRARLRPTSHMRLTLVVALPDDAQVDVQLRDIAGKLAAGQNVEVACAGLDVMGSLVSLEASKGVDTGGADKDLVRKNSWWRGPRRQKPAPTKSLSSSTAGVDPVVSAVPACASAIARDASLPTGMTDAASVEPDKASTEAKSGGADNNPPASTASPEESAANADASTPRDAKQSAKEKKPPLEAKAPRDLAAEKAAGRAKPTGWVAGRENTSAAKDAPAPTTPRIAVSADARRALMDKYRILTASRQNPCTTLPLHV